MGRKISCHGGCNDTNVGDHSVYCTDCNDKREQRIKSLEEHIEYHKQVTKSQRNQLIILFDENKKLKEEIELLTKCGKLDEEKTPIK